VTLLLLYAVVKLANRVIGHSIRRTRGLDATQQLLAQKLAGLGLLVAAFFIGIDIIGIDLTALAVFSGAFGLAVGFGLQKTFGNLIAGIILLMDRSIKPGDVIVVGESFGHVTKIGVRAVSVVTRDGKEHLIPNENLMTQEVENWSYSSRDVRVHIPVGVSYDSDLPLAQRLMVEAAAASERVLKNPSPTVWLRGFGDSSVDHEILVWITDPEAGVGNVQSEILNRLWVLFKENGIEIPFPQRDIRVKEWPSDQGPPAG
jgi:small-conductance mechanosensitive channel